MKIGCKKIEIMGRVVGVGLSKHHRVKYHILNSHKSSRCGKMENNKKNIIDFLKLLSISPFS